MSSSILPIASWLNFHEYSLMSDLIQNGGRITEFEFFFRILICTINDKIRIGF